MKSPVQLETLVKSANHKNQDEYFRQFNGVHDNRSQRIKPPGALSDDSDTENDSNQQNKTNLAKNLKTTSTDDTKIDVSFCFIHFS
jgi:hypothetical protein